MKTDYLAKFDKEIRQYRHHIRRFQLTGSASDLKMSRSKLTLLMNTARHVLRRLDEYKKQKKLDTQILDMLLNIKKK